jgi:shikimate dehydrogenase
MRTSLAPVQALVENRLPDAISGGLISVIGAQPSLYSKSPDMWNAALRDLGLDASYLAFDLPASRLAALLTVLRDTPSWWGANVTVPHKEAIRDLVDDVDASAVAAGAINTIVRTNSGRLIGANTDGPGLIFALLHDGDEPPLIEGLHGATVLVLGGGGAARAAVAALAPLLGTGEVLVANRTGSRARELAERASSLGGRGRAVQDPDLDDVLPSVDVLINASVVGQSGILPRPHGWTMLEAYSPLAPVEAPIVAGAPGDVFRSEWRARAAGSVEVNNRRALARVQQLASHAVVFDMVYAPDETVLLRHARAAGHRGANGRDMLIGQAVEALVRHICAGALADMGIDPQYARRTAQRAMAAAFRR